MPPPNKRNVKVKIGGKAVRVPKKVTATPKKHGRPKGSKNKRGSLPVDPWDLSDKGDLDRAAFEQIVTTFEGRRFFKEELSEEYVDAKMDEYWRGCVPKLITYTEPEQVEKAYASLMRQPINQPRLRVHAPYSPFTFLPSWESQALSSSFWITGGWEYTAEREDWRNRRERDLNGHRPPKEDSHHPRPRGRPRKVPRPTA